MAVVYFAQRSPRFAPIVSPSLATAQPTTGRFFAQHAQTVAAPNMPPPMPTTDSTQIASLLQSAAASIRQNDLDSAERSLRQVLEMAPGDAEAHRLMAIALILNGDRERAIEHLRKARASRPDDPVINMTLGSALVEAGSTGDGLSCLKRACEIAPRAAVTWCTYGAGLQVARKLEQARTAFEHALAIEPGFVEAGTRLAAVLSNQGDTETCIRVLRDILRRQPDNPDAWVIFGNLKAHSMGVDEVTQLRRLWQRADLPVDALVTYGFALAKGLEDLGDYNASYEAVCAANALKRRQIYWSRDEERGRVDAIAQAFVEPISDARDGSLGEEAIFVVSVPRSGSTLTEQILASHPEVDGCGETGILPDLLDEESRRQGGPMAEWARRATDTDWRRLGRGYLDRVRPLRGARHKFIDKTINNWALVGAIRSMLPGAHVIDVRRDPLETCFSCYRQLFQIGGDFTYDLDDMVAYYGGYRRLSALWEQRFPGRYFVNKYELLQHDPENQIRRLLDSCGLAFDPACLDFHKTRRDVFTISASQVKQPLQTDTARSALYGAKLDPLRAKLRAVGISNPQ